MTACQTPEARPLEGLAQVAPRPLARKVAFAGKCQDRVRPTLDRAGDGSGEMDTQKREAVVGDRIDQSSYQVPRRRFQHPIFASERDDAHVHGGAAGSGDPVGLKAGAGDDQAGLHRVGPISVTNMSSTSSLCTVRADQLGLETQGPAHLNQIFGQRRGHPAIVHDPRILDPQRTGAGGQVRLALLHLVRGHRSTADPVFQTAATQLVQLGRLSVGPARHQLAASGKGHTVCVAERLEKVSASTTELGLQRARSIVQPGMNDPRVVAALVGSGPVFLIDDRDTQAFLGQVTGCRETYQPRTDHCDVRHGFQSSRLQPVL